MLKGNVWCLRLGTNLFLGLSDRDPPRQLTKSLLGLSGSERVTSFSTNSPTELKQQLLSATHFQESRTRHSQSPTSCIQRIQPTFQIDLTYCSLPFNLRDQPLYLLCKVFKGEYECGTVGECQPCYYLSLTIPWKG